MRGYAAIGVMNGKSGLNLGSLWRTAHNFEAALLFTVGRRYTRQCSDTTRAWRDVPLLDFRDVADLHDHLPLSCELVGVELDSDATALQDFQHLERAAYLLGAEDVGLSRETRGLCHRLVMIPGGARCLNVAVAGSIVLWHRWLQREAA